MNDFNAHPSAIVSWTDQNRNWMTINQTVNECVLV